MRYLLLLLFIVFTTSLVAQQSTITVKAQSKSITVTLNDDNNDKSLLLNGNQKVLKTDKLVVYNSNSKELKDWQRSFFIFNEAGSEVLKLKPGPSDRYNHAALSDVF